MTIGLGPVFTFEWLRTARNWRVYAFRILFGLALLAVLGMVNIANNENQRPGHEPSIQEQAEAGQYFSIATVMTQLAMILLVAPAATAGTLCLDKQRGTLAHVMATDLTGAEVVLGKLMARMLPVFGPVFASLGIISICTLLGGIDPMGLLGSLMVSLGRAMLAGTLAFFLSIWAGKTHEVIMASCLIILAWVLFYPVWFILRMPLLTFGPPKWLEAANPFWIISEVRPGRVPIENHLLFMLGCLGISAVLILVAIWRIRAVAIHQMNRSATVKPKRKGWRRSAQEPRIVREPGRIVRFSRLFAPSLDRNPVLWREWHRMRPSWWTRIIWYAYACVSVAGSSVCIFLLASYGSNSAEGILIVGNALQLSVGLLLLSVAAATALAEERVRGSLDVLLATPLSTQSILLGKWWGAYRTVPVLAVLPATLIAAAVIWSEPRNFVGALSMQRATGVENLWGTRWQALPIMIGLTLAYGAAITSFGLAMATWISRLDRAVTATVATYLMITMAWPFLVGMLLSGSDDRMTAGLIVASPITAAGYTGILLLENQPNAELVWKAHVAWCCFWILAYVTIAAILFKLTLMSFNRMLGRIPDEGIAVPVTPELNALAAATGWGWRTRSRARRQAADAETTAPRPR